MKTSAALVSACATVALGAIEPKNFIFIIPDGLAPASATFARTYKALAEGGSTPGAPVIEEIPMDLVVCFVSRFFN
jgi:alkaline phosphatase